MSRKGLIDLYYGDEAGVSLEPNVPYGWQFRDEEVSMPSSKGKGINCFALVSRSNRSWTATSEQAISGGFVMEQLERFSFSIREITVVVLDNAPIPARQTNAGENQSVAAARIVHLLSADLLAASEH